MPMNATYRILDFKIAYFECTLESVILISQFLNFYLIVLDKYYHLTKMDNQALSQIKNKNQNNKV